MVRKRLSRPVVSLLTRLTTNRNDENAAKVSGSGDIFALFNTFPSPQCRCSGARSRTIAPHVSPLFTILPRRTCQKEGHAELRRKGETSNLLPSPSPWGGES